VSTRQLQLSDVDAAVDVLSSAFSGDPLLVWACGARERAGMRASCRMNISLWTKTRSAYGWFESDRLVAVALFQKPREHVSAWRALRAGFWRMPFAAGLVATQRIIHTFAVADRFKASLLGNRPHFYLDTLGVQQSVARRGLGPRLLLDSLLELRVRAPLPCFLLTHVPDNVKLYQRLGFKVIGQCAVPKTPITFWGMQQLPGAASAT
jgi:ribosomal protein S18 acetylase RimI-like enzyme